MIVTLTEQIKFIEGVFGSGRLSRNSRNFDVRCPICAPKDRTKKKLSILLPEHRLHCWVCGYKSFSLAPLIRKYGTYDQLSLYRARYAPPELEYKARCTNIWVIDDQEKQALQLPSDFKLLATSTTRDPDVAALRRYLCVDRKLSEDDLWFYKIGYSNQSKWFRRAIFPSFDRAGALNHYVARAIDSRRKPKYDSPDGDRKHIIFNEINVDWSKRLVLCEGVFDMVSCGENAVPLLGSDLNDESALFNAILLNSTPVALALDADMKLSKLPKVATALQGYDIDVVVVDVPTDPGELSKKEFKACLEAAKPFDWQRSFMDKLINASQISL